MSKRTVTKELVIKCLNERYPNCSIAKEPEKWRSKERITLYCNIHKECFDIQIGKILMTNYPKNICPICVKESRRMPSEEFFKRAKEHYGDRYDFSESVYNGSRNPIIVRCKEHGYFTLNKAGQLLVEDVMDLCPKCIEERRHMSTEEFYSLINDTIKEKYIFDEKFVFTGWYRPVTIKCPIHGYFEYMPMNLKSSQVRTLCPTCIAESKKHCNTEGFIEMVKEKFGDKYICDEKCVYKGTHTEVTLKCPKHGYFQVTPNLLLRDYIIDFCPECFKERRIKQNSEKFFNRMNEKIKGSNIYFGEDSIYVDLQTPMAVYCKKHGRFEIAPKQFHDLKVESLCPMCASEHTIDEEKFRKIALTNYPQYDFSEVKFIKQDELIKVYCKQHGWFFTKPINIIINRKDICPECKKINKQIAHSECKFTDFAENCKMKFPNNKIIYDDGEMYNVRVKLKCEIHGEFTVNTNHYYNYFGMCPECLKLEIKERFKHQSDFDAEIYKNVMELVRLQDWYKNDECDIIGPYYNTYKYEKRTAIYLINCKEHGETIVVSENYLIQHGCPKCKNGGLIRWADIDVNDFMNMYDNIYDYTIVLETFKDAFTPITLICKTHGVFTETPYKLITRNANCPECLESVLEAEIKQMLTLNKIKFVQHYRNQEWFQYKSLDFYLIDYNIAIECQGEQHFREVDYFSNGNGNGSTSFQRRKENDILKFNQCRDNNIKLFYYADKKAVARNEYAQNYIDYVFTSKTHLLKSIKDYIRMFARGVKFLPPPSSQQI